MIVGILIGYKNTPKLNTNYHKNHIGLDDSFSSKGIKLVRVSYEKYNSQSEVFKEYYIISKDGLKIYKEDIKVDLLRKRVSDCNYYFKLLFKNYVSSPSFELGIIDSNKYEIYMFTRRYQPYTMLLNKLHNEELKNFNGNKIVLKPLNAYGGEGIYIIDKDHIEETIQNNSIIEKQYIAQEFIDLGGGIPGIIDGYHDLRLVFLGEKLSYANVRSPSEGSKLSNLNQGGSLIYLKKESISKRVIDMAIDIQNMLGIMKNDYYSLDFGYSLVEDKRYFIEVNCSPGYTFPAGYQNEQEIFFEELCEFFKGLVHAQ